MSMFMAMAKRWTTEDGRSWPYDGPSPANLSDTPGHVRIVARSTPVTDHALGLTFTFDDKGAVTVRPVESGEGG